MKYQIKANFDCGSRKKDLHKYELNRHKMLPNKLSICQGKYGRKLQQDEQSVAKSFGKKSYRGPESGKETVKLSPMHFDFLEDC